jgi:YbbR domain-containing protein
VDLSDADQGRYVRSLTPADVTVPLDEDVEVLSVRSPTQLKADLDRVAVRRVHVAATAQHDPAGGFARVGAAVVNPDTVTIRGAESLVSGIQSLQTEPISLGGATRMVVARAKVDLGGLQRVTCDPEQVAVAIPVEKVEALTLANVRVRANADTTRWSVRCVPDVVEVGLTGPLSLMAGLRDRPPAMHIDVSRLGAGRYFFDVSVEKSGRVRLLPRDSVGPLAGVPDSLRTPEREPGARSLDAWIALPEGVFVARVDPYRFHIVVQQRGPRRDEGVPVPTS